MKKSVYLPVRPKIFVDLDGVLVDWMGAALKLGGLDPNDQKTQARLSAAGGDVDKLLGGAERVQNLIDNEGVKFWEHLRMFPWARTLMASLLREFSGLHGHVAFLTSPGRFTGAFEGKHRWQHNNFPEVPLILSNDKFLSASPSGLLIDDADYQVEPFRHYGGDAILWPNQYVLEAAGLTSQQIQDNSDSVVQNTVIQIRQSPIWA